MAHTAPTAQPLVAPSTSGETRGLAKMVWNTSPDRASRPPDRATASTRGRRIWRNRSRAISLGGLPVRIPSSSAGFRAYRPTPTESRSMAARAAREIQKRVLRFKTLCRLP